MSGGHAPDHGHGHAAPSHEGGGEKKGLAAYAEKLNPFKIASSLAKIISPEGVRDFVKDLSEFPLNFFSDVAMIFSGGGGGGGHGHAAAAHAH